MMEAWRFRRSNPAGPLSSADLLRECGKRLTDPVLWEQFQVRFHKTILRSITRVMWNRSRTDCLEEACDVAQDVYIRLLADDARLLRSFRGDTDLAVKSFLARVTVSIVSDHYRYQQASKRRPAEIVSIEHARQQGVDFADEDAELDIPSVLSWIDVDRLMEIGSDRRNAARNVLIFKLHYVDGFSVSEIAEFPAFRLKESAIHLVLQNMRAHLKKRMDR
jgi:RNA polymerase sigma factor (sigma-70 family)